MTNKNEHYAQRIAQGELKRTSLQLLQGSYDLAKEVARNEGMNTTELLRRAFFYSVLNRDILHDPEVVELEKEYYLGLASSRWDRDREP